MNRSSSSESRRVRVPDYQRAFAWEEKQIDLFIEDLRKYEALARPYYFGHFIVEAQEDDEGEWHVVDGQQRLTTFVLFLMVCRILWSCASVCRAFGIIERFSTVSYDQEALETIARNLDQYLRHHESFHRKQELTDEQIVRGLSLVQGDFTRSQRRIVLALHSFHRAFQTGNLDRNTIPSYIDVVMGARCSHHLTTDKSVAVNIFEMHNTRGIPLSTIEIVKAKLMKFVYDHAGPASETKVKQIQAEFGEIYKMEEQLAASSFRGQLTLTQLLTMHFRVVDDGSKRAKEELNSPPLSANAEELVSYLDSRLDFADPKKTIRRDPRDGVEYALNLAKEIKKSVRIVSETLPTWDEKERLVGDVLVLDRALSCQFFLIVCRRLETGTDLADGRLTQKALLLWERLVFTRDFHEQYYRLWYGDDFPALFSACDADEAKIAEAISYYLNDGFRSDRGTKGLQKIVRDYLDVQKPQILNNTFHWRWRGKMEYVLYKYERSHVPRVRTVLKSAPSLDHILPQAWDEAWGEEHDSPPRSLSESERQRFREEVNSYINGIGNLILIPGSENTSHKDAHPKDKSYDLAPDGGSYAEHERNRERWKSSSQWRDLIHERGNRIFDFMLATLVGAADESMELPPNP